MKNIVYCLLLVWVSMTACTQDDVPGAALPAARYLNLSYGTQAAQKLDVYLPADRTINTPLIIMIHGGGWSSGDKADLNQFVDTLQRRLPHYAIANINYRLASGTTNLFPTQENDVKAALEFIYSKRSEWSISDKFILLGASAGAHLAMLQAYKYNTPVTPKAVVDFFGPSDMVEMYNNPALPGTNYIIAGVMGGTPATHPQLYQQSSPIHFINSQSPPTIILHGGADLVVRPSQSEAVRNKLTTAGVANEYVFYANAGHGDWSVSTFADAFNKIQLFLEANVP